MLELSHDCFFRRLSMKVFGIALLSILFCAGLGDLRAQGMPEYEFEKTGQVELELGVGVGMGIDARSKDHWRSEPAVGIGLNYGYSVLPSISLHAGLSEQFFLSQRRIEHPYPYVMDMQTTVETFAVRFLAGGDWVFLHPPKGHSAFLGLGFYADLIHHANAFNSLYYISDTEHNAVDIRDSFSDPVPGLQLSLGAQGSSGKIEFRYWEDIRNFRIPTVPIGKQRRSGFAICGTLFL